MAKLRDTHHMVARLFAAGLTQNEIALRTGYAINRVSMFHTDPAFQELIAHYRKLVDERFVAGIEEFTQLVTMNSIRAERMIHDKLEEADEADELLPTRELLAIARDGADRIGLSKKTTNVNVNVDFAARLDQAMKKSTRILELKAEPLTLQRPSPAHSLAPARQSEARHQDRRRIN